MVESVDRPTDPEIDWLSSQCIDQPKEIER